jgi:ribosomal protein L6P/L9E
MNPVLRDLLQPWKKKARTESKVISDKSLRMDLDTREKISIEGPRREKVSIEGPRREEISIEGPRREKISIEGPRREKGVGSYFSIFFQEIVH